MIEHDYYKLMEIPAASGFDAVKKRYRELALLYHPDRNPGNRHAEEYFKIITQGYNLLGEPDQKEQYDRLLEAYYQKKTTAPLRPAGKKDEEVRDKIRKHREKKRLAFIEAYVKAENEFPHRYRFVLAIMVFVSGVLMCYNHWFLNLLNYKVMYIVLGGFLFGLGSYLTAENVYKRRSFKKAMRIEEYGEEAGPVRIFLLLFFMTPVLFLQLMSLTKTLHLRYVYDTASVSKAVSLYGEVTFVYSVNGEMIARQTRSLPGRSYHDLSRLRVRYSRINPYISELYFTDMLPTQ